MKVVKVAILLGAAGAAYGTYAWMKPAAPVANNETPVPTADLSDPKNKAVAEMAKFLESAPQGQLKAMNVLTNRSPQESAPWNDLVKYMNGTEHGVWIAQMLSAGGPLGTDVEARNKLLADPVQSAQEVQTVLQELPDSMTMERLQLLHFLGTLAATAKDSAFMQASLLRETQRAAGAMDRANSLPLPQAVALEEYFEIQQDPAKRMEAYNAALQAQGDPIAKAIIQRFNPAAVAAVVPPAATPHQQEEAAAEAPRAEIEAPRAPAGVNAAPPENQDSNKPDDKSEIEPAPQDEEQTPAQ